MLESVAMASFHGTDRWNAPWGEEAVVRPRACMNEDGEGPDWKSKGSDIIGDKVLPWASKVSLLLVAQRPTSLMVVFLL